MEPRSSGEDQRYSERYTMLDGAEHCEGNKAFVNVMSGRWGRVVGAFKGSSQRRRL